MITKEDVLSKIEKKEWEINFNSFDIKEEFNGEEFIYHNVIGTDEYIVVAFPEHMDIILLRERLDEAVRLNDEVVIEDTIIQLEDRFSLAEINDIFDYNAKPIVKFNGKIL